MAEDETDLRNYLSGVLQAEFKEVYVAADGEEAWELLGQYQPDIIVSDVMMPRTDGYELCRRIKNDVTVSHIPVVLLTARDVYKRQRQGEKLVMTIDLTDVRGRIRTVTCDGREVLLANIIWSSHMGVYTTSNLRKAYLKEIH